MGDSGHRLWAGCTGLHEEMVFKHYLQKVGSRGNRRRGECIVLLNAEIETLSVIVMLCPTKIYRVACHNFGGEMVRKLVTFDMLSRFYRLSLCRTRKCYLFNIDVWSVQESRKSCEVEVT